MEFPSGWYSNYNFTWDVQFYFLHVDRFDFHGIVIFYGPKSNNAMKTFLPENLPAKIMRKIKIAADFPSTIGVRCWYKKLISPIKKNHTLYCLLFVLILIKNVVHIFDQKILLLEEIQNISWEKFGKLEKVLYNYFCGFICYLIHYTMIESKHFYGSCLI